MKSVTVSLSLILCLFAGAQVPLTGTWRGTSICQIKNSPCHDEIAAYHVSQDSTGRYKMIGNKVIRGKEEYMGTFYFAYDSSKHFFYSVTGPKMEFTVKGDKMSGKMLHKGDIYRLIELELDQTVTASLIDTASIKKQLLVIEERDQKTRTRGDSAAFMNYIDSTNLARVEALIAKYGWMGKSLIGEHCNYILWLVIQHAPLDIQENYFPLMEQSAEIGESRFSDLAYLQDRILMRQGKKQIYGTQVVPGKNGKNEFFPIEDEKNVNERRKKAGLQPIEEYADYFGIEYKQVTSVPAK